MDGFSNLSAMEIDPNGSIQDLLKEHGEDGAAGAEGGMGGLGGGPGGLGGMMQDLAFSVSRSLFSFFPLLLPYFPPLYIRNIIWGEKKEGEEVLRGAPPKKKGKERSEGRVSRTVG